MSPFEQGYNEFMKAAGLVSRMKSIGKSAPAQKVRSAADSKAGATMKDAPLSDGLQAALEPGAAPAKKKTRIQTYSPKTAGLFTEEPGAAEKYLPWYAAAAGAVGGGAIGGKLPGKWKLPGKMLGTVLGTGLGVHGGEAVGRKIDGS